MKNCYLLIFFSYSLFSQNIDVNNDFLYQNIRSGVLSNDIKTNYSLNIRPINFANIYSNNVKINYNNFHKTIVEKKIFKIKFLGLDYFTEYNSRHPYNRNNGTMIPNRGYQHLISPGFFLQAGPLTIKIKPEHHFSENKNFDGFWEGHYPIIWAKRYSLWNRLDIPERFGTKRHNKTTLGQSSVRLNYKNISFGISNENLWWGPAFRNGIMMSNHARGFKHITLNTIKPIVTKIGNFEGQIITGRLEGSGYTPPNIDFEYAGTQIYYLKRNQLGDPNDWRFLQGYIFSYSPKWIDGLSFGFIRWVQMYSALIEGKYFWMDGKPTYWPAFQNLFRSNDKFKNYEEQTNQAAGIFGKWHWKDSKAEIYFEFHHNDSKQNLRDLILDSDHSRAATIGIQKIFDTKHNSYLFSWEWTQMEQTAGRLLRNAGSWYEHAYVYHGYSNYGEVLGSSIGPGSNSHYFSINRIKDFERIGIAFEVVDQDNDFYHMAFSRAQDYRRFWKDLNLHISYQNNFKNFSLSANFAYIRSLNYQWQLDDYAEPYYHPGKDTNNFHLNIKLSYYGDW